MRQTNDFSKLSCFIKGTLITAEVIEKSKEKLLRNEAKMHFNRILSNCKSFEKFLQRELGPEVSDMEDDINSSIIGLVWNLYEMTADQREQFIDYINEFEYKPKTVDTNDTN
jgi:hypothetical protein